MTGSPRAADLRLRLEREEGHADQVVDHDAHTEERRDRRHLLPERDRR